MLCLNAEFFHLRVDKVTLLILASAAFTLRRPCGAFEGFRELMFPKASSFLDFFFDFFFQCKISHLQDLRTKHTVFINNVAVLFGNIV